MKNLRKILIMSLLIGVLTACGTNKPDNAEPGAASGQFALYTSQPEEDVAKLITAFNEEYPNIKVNVFRSGTEEVISKVRAEKESGSIQADALLVSDSFTFEGLASEDILQEYKSTELAEIPEDYVDDQFLYTGTKLIVTGLAVNTDLVDPATVKSFADLTKAELKDKVIIPSPLYSGAASLNLSIQLQQESMGWELYEGLKANNVFVGKGNGTVRDGLLNGEQGVGVLVDYMAIRAKNSGAPLEFIYAEEGALYVTEPIGIVKDSKNAEQAKKFVDFILSEKGQKIASDMGYTPIRKGVSAPEGLKGVAEITPIPFDAEKVIETREQDKGKFADLFGQN